LERDAGGVEECACDAGEGDGEEVFTAAFPGLQLELPVFLMFGHIGEFGREMELAGGNIREAVLAMGIGCRFPALVLEVCEPQPPVKRRPEAPRLSCMK